MMFENMIRDWFADEDVPYNNFIKALLLHDVEAMDEFMNEIALVTFSRLDPIIIEFRVRRPLKEVSQEETVAVALGQIRDKNYDAALVARGFEKMRIRHYGFAFEGKQVLIGQEAEEIQNW